MLVIEGRHSLKTNVSVKIFEIMWITTKSNTNCIGLIQNYVKCVQIRFQKCFIIKNMSIIINEYHNYE